jgi:hypothetical protein
MRVEVVLAAALMAPPAVSAQLIELRYRPATTGLQLQNISETTLHAAVFGLPSLPDSTVIESTWRTVETLRVLEATAGYSRVRISVDSSRSRARIGSNARADILLPGVEGLSGVLTLGPLMEIHGFTPETPQPDSAYTAVMTARIAGFELTLPQAAVLVGEGWSTPFQYPIGAHLSSGGRLSSAHGVHGVASIILDSVIPRGRDTLAFFSLDAPIEPAPGWIAAEGGIGTVTFRGRLIATLIWSTGWHSVVSAGTAGRIDGRFRIERADGNPIDGRVSLAINARHRVRL